MSEWRDISSARWLDAEERERFQSRPNDMHVHALLGALAHCYSAETALKLMAQTIFDMSRHNEHYRNLAAKALSIQPRPQLLIRDGEIEHIDGDPTNNEVSNLRVVPARPRHAQPDRDYSGEGGR